MNLSVHTPDKWLALITQPLVEAVSQYPICQFDWLIICAGFEDRALAVLNNAVFVRNNFNVLLVNYEPFFQENKANAIRTICQQSGVKMQEVTYNRQEPAGFGATILEILSKCRGQIFVDISAMSRLLIVQILAALGSRKTAFAGCFVAYAEARDYTPTEPEAEAELIKSNADPCFSILFLSSGIFDVTIIPELSSFAPSGTQTRLIAFPSLDAHHLTALRNEIQPSRFSFIEGIPPKIENRWRQRLIALANRLETFPQAERFQTSTLDYRETLHFLLELYSSHGSRERLLISPTGSKMQTVAVGIFRAFINDVQIVFPTPVSYIKPNEYTFGVGQLHLLSLSKFAKF